MSEQTQPAAREATVTPIKKAPRDPFDFPLEKKTIEYKGIEYTFRELTLAENDLCREAATTVVPGEDDLFDGRVMMRMMIVTASVTPEIDIEQLGKFPARLYSRVVDLVNDLNDADKQEKDEDPGNS